jgi:hypothetical protein
VKLRQLLRLYAGKERPEKAVELKEEPDVLPLHLEPAEQPETGAGSFPSRGECPDELMEDFEERAAIMEYDGGIPRQEAERLARIEQQLRLEVKADEKSRENEAERPQFVEESNKAGYEGRVSKPSTSLYGAHRKLSR